MLTRRARTSFIAFFVALTFSAVASAATAEFRVLFDVDDNASTGCTVDGMQGVEQVLITSVTTTDTTATTDSVRRRVCTGGTLGNLVDVEPAGWPAGFQPSSGNLLVESRLPYGLIGDPLPSNMRVGIATQMGSEGQVFLQMANGDPILYPVPHRRRAVGAGPARVITLDGVGTDWGGIAPLVTGTSGSGTNVRVLKTYVWGDGSNLYFRFDANLAEGEPVANDDNYSVRQGGSIGIAVPGVLANDTDPSGAALAAELVTNPAHASAFTLNPNGSFTYTNDGSPAPSDSFQYKATNGAQDSNPATVNIAVTPNHAPVGGADSYSVPYNGSINITAPGVLGNDSDADGDTLTAAIATSPSHSSAFTLNSDGSFNYTHNGDSATSDSFTYTITDGIATTGPITVTLSIGANSVPVANGDSYNVDEGGTLTVAAPGVLGNDTDADAGQPLSATLVTGPAHGSVSLNADGSFTYVNNGLEFTSDSFTYTVSDGIASSSTATVAISINPINDAPTATNDNYSTSEDTTLVIPAPGVLTNDSDVDGGALSAQIVANPVNGTVTLNADGSFSYTPNADYFGSDVFTYQAFDGTDASNTATVTITINAVNDEPVATDDVYSVNEDSTLTIAAPGVLANDSDVDGNALTAILVSNVTHGTLALNANGGFTYTPAANYFGPDSFTYKANDGSLDSNVATVLITVTNVNDAPVATADAYATNEDTTLNVAAPGVLANDTDIDVNALTAVLVTNVTNGALTLNANGSFSYTPNANFFGSDSFTYKANDGTADSNTVTVTITVNPVNDAPVATADSYSTNEDTALNVAAPGVLANDTDAEGNTLTAVLVTGTTNGSLTLNANGSFSYTPNANFFGSDSFTYKANDGSLDSNTVTVTITVTAVNDAPVATADAYSTNEDTPLTVTAPGVLSNDTDVDGNSLTAVLVTNVTNGSLTLNADGSFTYTPNANYNGADSFTYKANDGTADSNTVTVTITINAVNDAPVAVADAYSTNEDTALNVPAAGVLANDTDTEGNALTAVLVTGPANGSLTLNADGSFTYTPNANFNGSDSFTYKANDGSLDSNTVTVTITVNAVNDAPVAVADAYSTNEDTALNIAAAGVLANDSDVDGNPLTAILVTNVTNGSLTLNADGSFTYTPNANYNGSDSFTYKANDGSLDSNTVTVTITINAVNDAPVAVADAYSTNEDTTLNVAAAGVLANDTDVEGNSLTAVLVSGVTNGSLTLNADGSFSYTPNANFFGSDSFTYKANDGSLDSNTVTVTITVNPVNDAPVAAGDAYSTNEDTPLNVTAPGVLSNDTDVEGNSLTAILVSGPSSASSFTLNADGSFSYTPNANFFGSDSFTYKANDGSLDSNTVTVTITVNAVNDAPVAVADSYSTNEDTPLTITAPGVLTNDTDTEGNTLTAVLVTNVTNGTLTLNSDGSFTYTPNPDFNGSDSFTYKANDGTADSNTVTVDITVNAVNDAPVATGDSYSTNEDTPLNVTAPGVLSNDTDVEGNSLTAVLVSGPTSASSFTLNADGSFSYTPNADFNGSDSFTYKANDGSLDSNTVTVNITVNAVNDAPVATGDAYSTNEDTPLTVTAPGVLANDTDVDGNSLTAVLVTDVTNGTLTLNADGSFTYTPNANYNGADSFTYKANDGSLDSNTVTVNITINAVNDAPVAVADAYSTNEDTPLNVAATGVLGNDTDVEGDSLTAVLVTGPSNASSFTLNADGSFSYTPNADYNGSDSFTYKANDGSLDSNTVTVTLTINAVNDAPVATADAYSTNEDTPLTVTAPGVLSNDTDVDGNSLTAILVSGPANASSFTLNSDGSFSYTPNADYNGSDSFTYKANDGSLDSNTVTVNITINAVNDAPVAVADAYSTNEDTPLNVAATGVLGNDTDLEGNTLTAVLVTGPSNASSFTLNSDGSFSYTPNGDFNGSDSFTYKANDGSLDSNTVTVTITINAVNDAPVATGDAYSTNEDTPLNVTAPGVLSNDTDVEGNPLTAVLVTGPSSASSFTLNADGSFSYTPNADYNGSDSFTYKANDGSLDSNTVTVNITINAVNDAPVAVADAYSTNEDAPLTVTAPGVLTNDTDTEGNTLTAVLVTNVTNGNLTLNADGSFTYSPNPDFNGSDSFTYKANDGTADSNTVTVNITINAVNDAPTVTPSGNLTYTEGDNTVTLDGGVTVTDPDDTNIASATVQITGNYTASEDILGFTNTPNITGSFDSLSGTLTLTGTDTIANYQAALRTVTYENTSNAPSNATRTVTWNATDPSAATGAGLTSTITVISVNTAPTVTTSNNASYTENAAAITLEPALTVTDPDSANLTGATISITTNFQSAEDVLAFTTNGTITGSYNSGTGVLTLSGTDTVANYQAVLRTVTYNNTSDNPNTTTRMVTWVVTDGTDSSSPANTPLDVVAVNDAPTVTAGSTVGYTENGPALTLESGLTVTDPDNTNLASATVSITGNFNSAQDVLAFTTNGTITGSYNSGTGVLSLSGTDTVANYQAVLRTVTYQNSSDDPTTGARTITWIVNDGTDPSTGATTTVNITAVNDAPTLTAGATLSYTENDAATAIDTTITVADLDNANLSSATVQITGNYVNGEDVLSFVNTPQITGSFNAGTGTLTLTGTDTVANYQAALRAVKYANTSNNPSTSARTVSWTVNDGTANSNTPTSTINVTATNDAPVVTAGNTLGYTEDAGAVAASPAITVTDADNANLASATVQITGNYVNGEDLLAFTNTPQITGSFNAGTGTLTLTGTDTVANYQAALQSVTYENVSQNPSAAARTLTWIANDGTDASAGATSTINVTNVNDAPVLTAGGTLNYTEADPATAIDTTITLSDVDTANMASATVQITGNYQLGQDVLSFVNTPQITGVFTAASGTLTLTGSDTVANYQTALRSVLYNNTSNAPSGLSRTVTWTVNDGTTNSNSPTSTINVTPVNSAPVIVAGNTLAYSENDPPTAASSALSLTDVDSTQIQSASVQITANYVNGEDVLAFVNTPNITGSFNAGTGTLSLSGADTVANYQAALRSITYANTSDTPSTAARTLTWLATDNEGGSSLTSAAVTSTINVTAVNDAPVLTAGATLSYTEDDPATVIDNTITISDVDSTTLTGATVSITGNFATPEDVLSFVNTPNITGSYNGATGVLTLTGTDTLANYQAALRSVKYNNASQNPSALARTISWRVNDGGVANNLSNIATSTVNVTPVNDAPVLTAGGTLSYTENAVATAIDATVTLTDVDSANMVGATITISANYQLNKDVLSFTNTANITGSFNAATGVLTLTGTDTKANYQTALRNVKYNSTSEDPSTLARTITWQVNDGGAVANLSNQPTSTINVTAVNDPPVAVGFTNLPAQAGIPITYPAGKLSAADDPEEAANGPTTVTLDTTPINLTNIGSITLNANGSFTVTPLPGSAGGTASFQYRASDNGRPGAGANGNYVTVSFSVAGPAIYFVKNPAVGLGNCTLGNECLIATAVANIGASTNANIFLEDANTHTLGANLALTSGSSIIGQGLTGFTFDNFFGIGTPAEGTLAARPSVGLTRPTVSGGSIALHNNSKARGFNISVNGNTSGITATSRTGLQVDLGTVATSNNTGNTTYAVNIDSSSGTLFTFGAITGGGTGAASHGFRFNNSTSTTTVTGTTINTSTGGGKAFDVATTGATSFTFTNVTSAAGAAVTVNTATTGVFSFNNIVSTTGAGMTVTTGGSGNYTVNDVTSTTGSAVTVNGASGTWTFHAVNANGATKGMSVTSYTGSSFSVTGTGTTAGTGGTIQNCTTRGVELISSNNVTLKNMNVNSNGTTAPTSPNASCADGLNASISNTNTAANCQSNIHLQTVNTVTLDTVTANSSKQNGINGNDVTNLTLTNVTAQSNGDEAFEDGVQIANAKGTLTITNGAFRNNATRGLEVQNNTATPATVNVTGGTWGYTTFPVSATADKAVVIATNGSNGASITTTMKGMSITNVYSNAVYCESAGNTSMNVTFGQAGAGNGNTVSNVSYGISVIGTSSGNVTYNIANNSFTNTAGTVTGNSRIMININKGFGATGNWTGTIDSNTIGTTGVTGSGGDALSANGVSVASSATAGSHDVTLTNNIVRHVNGHGFFVSNGDAGTMRATITGNQALEPDDGSLNPTGNQGSGIFVSTSVAAASLNVKATGNNVTGNWNGAIGTIRGVRFSRASNSVFCINGYAGPFDATSVGNYLTSVNTGNPGSATQGTGSFTGGCPVP